MELAIFLSVFLDNFLSQTALTLSQNIKILGLLLQEKLPV
jgi:hypothetical protein